ncbi:MAG: class I SAM-dependent methyltransferase [candidate division KSB1 bacterium]|nr:class I SAM-dependent methyltransferase [candidate division KSB1 bacterium]MDZ7333730.1 class I SAM-dependent methyltransferase [candidate division KSB1 bacterium]MDZ7357061.1 class I SAM-dependent methyltransferase [candidate division KSB1 bacterium]MDZ7398844.1 class I SAM-dependent methyltransferase [candidate division KSB1 bacterium]
MRQDVWHLMEKFRERSREQKFNLFLEQLDPQPDDVILNIGAGNGLFLESCYKQRDKIIALDISLTMLHDLKRKYPGVQCLVADARALPFKDQSVKIAFSNAVIEHVGANSYQQQFANEIQRVCQKFFVTCPNKYFPFEFHYRLPLYQFVPKSIQRWLYKKFRIGLWYEDKWEDINLLSFRQLKKLFPGTTVIKQRVTLLPETLICYKN